MSVALLRLSCDAADLACGLGTLAVAAHRVSALEPFAEVRERLLGLGEVADQLVRVDVENVAGRAGQLRISLQLSDAGLRLSAALRARDVDPVVVEEALGHLVFSGAQPLGEDAESPGRETDRATTREARP